MIDMKKLAFFSIAIFILLVGIVFSAGFSVNVIKENEYLAGSSGIINVSVTNQGNDDWFSISVLGVPTTWLNPESSSLRVRSGQTETLKAYITISRDATPLTYQYKLTVTSLNTGEKVEKDIMITVRQITSAVIKDFSLSCNECKDKVEFSGKVENVGTQPLEPYLIVYFGEQKKRIDFGKLAVDGFKIFKDDFNLEGKSPGSYEIKADLFEGENLLYSDKKEFYMASVQKITYDEKISSSLFGRGVLVTATNAGNVAGDAEIKSKVSKKWYSLYSGPEPTIKNGEYVWKMTLQPGESTNIKYSEVYWITYLVLFAIIFGGFFGYREYIAVKLRKKIFGHFVKKGKAFSVSLHVKNMVREMDDLIVRDIIPAGFSAVREFETIKPLIRKISGERTELVWKVGKLRAHEERILHYKIIPLGIVPFRVKLPQAELKVKYIGRIIHKYSNPVILFGKREKIPSILSVKVSK